MCLVLNVAVLKILCGCCVSPEFPCSGCWSRHQRSFLFSAPCWYPFGVGHRQEFSIQWQLLHIFIHMAFHHTTAFRQSTVLISWTFIWFVLCNTRPNTAFSHPFSKVQKNHKPNGCIHNTYLQPVSFLALDLSSNQLTSMCNGTTISITMTSDILGQSQTKYAIYLLETHRTL